jgi:6-phosphogluconolactonase (cycloisomerase 2 family)
LDQAGAGSYDVENATYANKSFSVATEESGPQAMHFKSDGTQFFLVGNTDTVRSYSLSTAWDISTTSYDSKSISVNAQNSIPLSVHVKSDGTKFYMLGTGTGGDAVYSYSMSTAYDLSTASYDSVSFSVATQTTSPQAMWFKPDGTTMYIASSTVVYQYTLSTAWNISTASYASKSFTTSTQDTNMDGLTFKSDGTKVYMTGVTNDNVYQYSLSTAWDISTASYDSIALDTSSESGDPRSLQLSSDGKVLMVLGTANDTVYQYNASAPATITYDSTLQFGGGTAPESPAIGETDVLTFSTRDGGTTYQAAIAIDGAA